MKVRGFLAVALIALAAFALGAQGRNDKQEASPHTAALQLVFKTQQAVIREVDNEDWRHDVKERSWVVKRPFSPGYIDSTHLFHVSYVIAGTKVATWCVDTRKGQVQLLNNRAKER